MNFTKNTPLIGPQLTASDVVCVRVYLRNGSGAAPPGVQHDGILMPLLQHFILRGKTQFKKGGNE